ncbi:MAG: 2-C-methyl-D-erythritol 2,4-cyclodiphosphate synthase [Acidimicrobiia bacterium]
MTARVGLGFDVHPFGGDGPLVLGGVSLPGVGLAGHSDADVIAHAVADALLGAAGLPDLGAHFPADDDRYRDASSMGLLRTVAEMVAGEGWEVGNVDVVVAAEEPRLAPHLPAMVSALEDALVAVRPETVTVKAKRAEGLGAIGRAEGIAAWAVALLVTLDES